MIKNIIIGVLALLIVCGLGAWFVMAHPPGTVNHSTAPLPSSSSAEQPPVAIVAPPHHDCAWAQTDTANGCKWILFQPQPPQDVSDQTPVCDVPGTEYVEEMGKCYFPVAEE